MYHVLKPIRIGNTGLVTKFISVESAILKPDYGLPVIWYVVCRVGVRVTWWLNQKARVQRLVLYPAKQNTRFCLAK